jgi:6-pyruvoyltetrahydropterin/6-carboxytetrahydropterin synthase
MTNRKVAVYRKEHFNAAHRLNNTDWDAATNQKIFGKCNNENYHGHNYELVVKVVGVPDEKTGFVIDLKIIDKFDHKNLNLDVPEFVNVNPTAENIAIVIYNLLSPKLPSNLQLQVRLYETERNFVEYPVD